MKISHWETGKAADAMIYEPGDLPDLLYGKQFVSMPRVTGCTDEENGTVAMHKEWKSDRNI